MQKHILVLTTSAFILACGAITAGAQQTPGGPMIQQPDEQPTMQQIQERVRQIEEALAQRRDVEDYDDDWDDNRHGRGMRGGGYGAGWRHHQGWGREGRNRGDWGREGWGRGGTDRGMGPGMMGPGMGLGGGMGRNVVRILFALMDADGDGTISLDEFRAAHERIFKAMDGPDKDGRVTLEEMLVFMQGAGRLVPRQ
jgi:rSAM-associated Gly-rich repeat protein